MIRTTCFVFALALACACIGRESNRGGSGSPRDIDAAVAAPSAGEPVDATVGGREGPEGGASDGGEANPAAPDGGEPAGEIDSGTPPDAGGDAAPSDCYFDPGDNSFGASLGAFCTCDYDCSGTRVNPGRCSNGICMRLPSGPCGSTGSCPTGSRCIDFVGGSLCHPVCASTSCAGTCTDEGLCAPGYDSSCLSECAEFCVSPYDGIGLFGGTAACPQNSHPNASGDCVCDPCHVVSADRSSCVPE